MDQLRAWLNDVTRTETRLAAAVALACLLVQGLLLAPSFGHDFALDDALYIVENPAVTDGVPVHRYFSDRTTISPDPLFQVQSYRPLRTMLFRLVAAAAGMSPWAYRVANLALFAVAALFVVRLLSWLGAPRGAAALAVAVFFVLPVHVEPLVYASALGDNASLALQMASIDIVMRRWFEGDSRTRWRLPTSLLLSMAAMLTKEAAVVTPALLVVLGLSRSWPPGGWRNRWIIDVAAHGALVVAFLWLRTAALGVIGHAPISWSSVSPAVQRLPWLILRYLGIVVSPLGHIPGYEVPVPGLPWALAAAVVVAGSVVLLAWRGDALLRTGAGWFVIALLPVLGLVPIAADMGDRYALLATIGAAPIVARLWQSTNARWPRAAVATFAAAWLLYAAGSAVEQAKWKDDASLWEKTVEVEPSSRLGLRNLGLLRLQAGRPDLAQALFERARRAGGLPKLDYYAAMALDALGRYAEAEAAIERELAVDPACGHCHAIAGGLKLRRGDLIAARASLQRAETLAPTHPSTQLLGIELASHSGNHDEAVRQAETLVARAPRSARFRGVLARALLARAPGRAAEQARTCLRMQADDPGCAGTLGLALASQGHGAQARRWLERALPDLGPGPHRQAVAEALRGLSADASTPH